MAPLKVVFLDIDNTMYDIDASIHTTLEATYAEHGDRIGVDFHRFEAAYWGATAAVPDAIAVIRRSLAEWRDACLRGALHRLAVEDHDLLPALVESFDRHRLDGMRPFPGAIEAVTGLAQRFRLGVITNGPSPLQRQKVEVLGVADLVEPDLLIVSGETPWDKPDPRIFTEAAKRAGVAPAACCMVGDSIAHDMPASALGFRTVLVNSKRIPIGVPHVRDAQGRRLPGPDAVIETPAELPLALSKIEKGDEGYQSIQ